MFYAYDSRRPPRISEDDRRWLVPPVISAAISTGIYFAALAVRRPLSADICRRPPATWWPTSHITRCTAVPRFELFNVLRRRHMQHHYTTPERWYGVSTPLWDYVFRTTAPARRDPGTVALTSLSLVSYVVSGFQPDQVPPARTTCCLSHNLATCSFRPCACPSG
jgi:hypothetical protein